MFYLSAGAIDKAAVAGEDAAQGQRGFVLHLLQLAVELDVGADWLGGFRAVQLDKLVGDVADGDPFAALQAPAPEACRAAP